MKSTVLQGLLWVFSLSFLSKIIDSVTVLVLAGLLDPVDFGLFALVAMILGWISFFKELGFSSALIAFQDKSDDLADTAFVVIVAVNILLYLFAFAVAPVAAVAFRRPELVAMTRVLALSFIVNAFQTVQVTLLRKNMDFRRFTWPALLSSCLTSPLCIGLAIQGLGVWSLVYGALTGAVLQAVIYWYISPFRPRWRFNMGVAKSLFGFGGAAVADNIAWFGFATIDHAVVGRMLGSVALGYYDLAYRFANVLLTSVLRVAAKVTLPAFATMQDDLPRFKALYLRMIHLVAAMTVPATLTIGTIGPLFLRAVYGEKWVPAIIPLQVLTLYGFAGSLSSPTGTVFYALRKPRMALQQHLLQLGMVIPFMWWASSAYGLLGVAVLFTACRVIGVLIAILRSNSLLGISSYEYAAHFRYPLLAALPSTMLGLVLYRAAPLAVWSSVVAVGCLFAIPAVSYLGILLLLDQELRVMAKPLVQSGFQKTRARLTRFVRIEDRQQP